MYCQWKTYYILKTPIPQQSARLVISTAEIRYVLPRSTAHHGCSSRAVCVHVLCRANRVPALPSTAKADDPRSRPGRKSLLWYVGCWNAKFNVSAKTNRSSCYVICKQLFYIKVTYIN